MYSNRYVPFAKPDLGEDEIQAVSEVLRSGWITTGEVSHKFEALFAENVGAKYSIAVTSWTAAAHLALESIGLAQDDQVITSPYTFAATAEIVRYFNATPVFVDVNSTDFNINTENIERAITHKTKAIIPVHMAGLAANLDALQQLADKYELRIIEDAAHAFPATYSGQKIGSLSDFTCFSFYATKNITTAEGGMICTNNESFAERCRIMSLHGINKDAWRRYSKEGSWYYEIIAPGFKYNMTDIAAALGIQQLKKADVMHTKRCDIAHLYDCAFKSNDCLELPYRSDTNVHAWHLYMLRLNLETLVIDRNRFIEELRERGVGASVHFIPLHIHPYYRNTYKFSPSDFPVAFKEYEREISLPIYSAMTREDVETVAGAVLDISEKFKR